VLPLKENDIKSQFNVLNPIQKELFESVSGLKGLKSGNVEKIISLQSNYLPQMDGIVEQFQKDAEANLIKIRNKQIGLAILSGLILILEILFLVIPYHRKLIIAFRDIKSQKKLIEQQQTEIQLTIHLLSQQNIELENLYQTQKLTLAAINACVWNVTLGKEEVSWSPNFYKLLGYERNEIPANFEAFVENFIHPEHRQALRQAIEDHIKLDAHFHLNIRIQNKNGQYKWYEASGMGIKNSRSKLVQLAGSIMDIDQKMSYQEQLEGINQTKDKLFAIIAHDLRSPIGSIKSLLDFYSEGDITEQELG
jgi:PAS domain S-box-containing protein